MKVKKMVELNVDNDVYKTLTQKFQVEVEKMRTDLVLFQQKGKIADVKLDEFQEDVYKTVQNLSKEMNEAFQLIHKNANLASTLNNSNGGGKERNEQIEIVSKITDQNVRNVFNAFEKHKLYIEEQFKVSKIEYEKLRNLLAEMQTDVTVQNVMNKNEKNRSFRNTRNSAAANALVTTNPGGF